MATKPEEPLELTEEMEAAEPEEAPEQKADPVEPGEEPDEETEETSISFGDDAEEKPDDNSTIRHLREKLKEKDRELSDFRKAAPQQKIEIGDKPTLAGCDYDEDRFSEELDAFNARKFAAEADDRKANEAKAEADREWQQDFAAFGEKKAKLAPTVPDMDDLEQTVVSTLDLVQQAVMVKAANDPALFMVALAKNPAKLAELAKIKDPIKLASAIARMEGGIKVVVKRKAPSPDRAETGSAAMPGDSDKQLEKLEKEAERTGSRTALIAYKKKRGLK